MLSRPENIVVTSLKLTFYVKHSFDKNTLLYVLFYKSADIRNIDYKDFSQESPPLLSPK